MIQRNDFLRIKYNVHAIEEPTLKVVLVFYEKHICFPYIQQYNVFRLLRN